MDAEAAVPIPTAACQAPPLDRSDEILRTAAAAVTLRCLEHVSLAARDMEPLGKSGRVVLVQPRDLYTRPSTLGGETAVHLLTELPAAGP